MDRSKTTLAASRGLALAALGALALAACQTEGARTDTAATDDTIGTTGAAERAPGAAQGTAPPPTATRQMEAGAVTEANIPAILTAANQAEIRPSELAQERAQNPQVRQYAERMIREHSMLDDSLQAITQQQNLTGQQNQLSQQMQTETQSAVQRLQGLSGAEFDREYMRFMVDSHQMTLDAIDRQLLQAARTPQLRTALEQRVRPAVEQHLEQARQLQNQLGNTR